ncbi:sigma-70 family RNA polymerase sigma factor [Sinomonas mesophila]|uniref:RNA polymerase sigma factor n=1 Tax=Sinomonas mesophila TaxID=1531955 RepID=UPI0009856949
MRQVDTKASDTALWSLVLNGEGEAFGQVFDRYRDRVFNYSQRLIRSSQDAEDATAMVFLECWRCRNKVRVVNGSLLPWLLATTNNVARNHLRSTWRYSRLLAKIPGDIPIADPADSVAEDIDRQRQSRQIRMAFQSLRRPDREILALGILGGLSLADIAGVLNIPLGTVKSRLSRAKHRLARLLESASISPLQEQDVDGRLR